MKRFLIVTGFIILFIYVVICTVAYLFQEKLIFLPQSLPASYKFHFDVPFEEITVAMNDAKKLNALLFKAENAKGVIFYLHGNAGSLASWGDAARVYTDLGYDVFMIDYRGYGKSEGSISGERQIMEDMQVAYDELKKRYQQTFIVMLGYSIGTGPAAQLAAKNNPRLLILQAPYYKLADVGRKVLPIVPMFLLKYRFETYRYLQRCKMPVIIFHGARDQVIPYQSALKLKELFKATDTLITLPGLGHNGMTFDERYRSSLKDVLN
jgi:hypothetical protein